MLVDRQHFERYLELWNVDHIPDPPFPGRLSGGIRAYPDSDLLEVQVELQPGNKRPRLRVVSAEHALGQDQRAGILLAQVHTFIEAFMPSALG